MSCSPFEDKRVLCIAQTPFHLLALVCLFGKEERRNWTLCDVVIWDQFSSARNLCNRLQTQGLFTHVECIDAPYPEYNHLGLTYVADMLFRKDSHESWYRGLSPILGSSDYDVLMIGAVSRFSLDAKRYNAPSGMTYFFDDGTGTRSGSIFRGFSCFDFASFCYATSAGLRGVLKNIAKRICTVAVGRKGRFGIQRLFAFEPASLGVELHQALDIESLTVDGNEQLIQELFLKGVREELPLPKNIFFSLPHDAPDYMLAREDEILSELMSELTDVAIKVHPRRDPSDFEHYGCRIIGADIMWEALVASSDVESDVTLIGFVSSAQVHPKLIFGQEPHLVFLGYGDGRGIPSGGMVIIDSLRMAYDHPERIRVLG